VPAWRRPTTSTTASSRRRSPSIQTTTCSTLSTGGQQEIWEAFDLTDVDLDPSDINETPIQNYELEEVTELADLDMRRFDDETQAAQAMIEMLEWVREHEFTDEHGEIDSLRWWLEHQLRAANVAEDRFHLPVDAYRDLFRLALLQHDAGADAEQTLQDIRDGAYA